MSHLDYIQGEALPKSRKAKIQREFIRYKDGKFYWIDAKFKENDIELMTDNHLFNSIQFLYDWAGDKHEDRNLELSIMVHEEQRRDELKKTEAGKLLYTV